MSLFDFADASDATAINGSFNFSHRLTARMTMRARYQLTRATTDVTPFFANRTNVSGDAGIIGNNQDPVNWGPPTLAFAGIAGLTDVSHQQTTRMSNSGGGEVLYRRGAHNLTMGGDVRGDRTDVLSQPDPRGTLSFTGPVTGVPFADFLLGVPTASSIAFGDTATRLRAKAFDAYLNDDWRPLANLTINLGVRWEYETPYTEVAGHLVNLDVAPGFAAIAQVTPADPTGALTGASYPASLIRPDKGGLQPRLGVSWRPSLSSSLVVKGGYGIYRNLGVYESIGLLLAHQPPFSTTFSIQNSLETPLTLANPFPSSLPGTTNTVAIDPDFRSGYAHTWQVTAQRELPASLTVIAAYLGAKGSHLMQAFLPNTYPTGAGNPCPASAEATAGLDEHREVGLRARPDSCTSPRTAARFATPRSSRCAGGCTRGSWRACSTRSRSRRTTPRRSPTRWRRCRRYRSPRTGSISAPSVVRRRSTSGICWPSSFSTRPGWACAAARSSTASGRRSSRTGRWPASSPLAAVCR